MINSKPKIVFLLASISQPRCLKRVRSFIDAGFEVEIYGFDRGLYNVNAKLDNHEIVNLGFSKSGSDYFKKLFFARKKIKGVFDKHKNDNVLYYSFSYDISLICNFYKKKYIYEISDLVYGYFTSKSIRDFFVFFDKKLISNSFLTVMTSQGFNDFLFPDKKRDNVLIQPNRIDSYFFDIERTFNLVSVNNLSFSYVGAFRYPNTVFRFAKVIGEKYPNHKFLFFGDSKLTDQVKYLANKYDNVHYYGQFKNPEDLSSIYSQIDIVVASYDVKTLNERIAEPNKLYESMFFNKPIIVSENTFLEKQVLDKYKCGFSIDASIDENIVSFIDSLDSVSLNNMIEKIDNISSEEIIDDGSANIIKYMNTHI